MTQGEIRDEEQVEPSEAVLVRPARPVGPARRRWLSRRALLLHLEVAIVAPACAVAGWWQATRALAGNELSWAYSVEWPAFALIAIAGWWHLIHEDPEAYRARKSEGLAPPLLPAPPSPAPLTGEVGAVGTATARHSIAGAGAGAGASVAGAGPGVADERVADRLATALAVLVALEFVFGVVALFAVPLNRPSASLPTRGETVYLVHAIFGALLAGGALVFVVRFRSGARTYRVAGWMGFTGVMVAAAGGLLTEAPSLARFLGMALMFVGSALAAFGYVTPILLRLSRQGRVVARGLDRPEAPELPAT